MINSNFGTIKKLFSSGFFHIALSGAANKIIAAISNIMIIRVLGKYDYGIMASANNILGIFVVFAGLGMSGAVLIFCSEKRAENEKTAYYRYGLTQGIKISAVLSVIMLLYAFFGRLGIPESRRYIIMLSALPVLEYIMQHFLVVLRTRRDNKSYAKYTSLYSILYLVLGCTGAWFWGIPGAIAGSYGSHITIIVLCLRKVTPLYSNGIVLNLEKRKAFWTYSLRNGFSSAINQLLYLVDVALIAFLICDAETVALYKVAVAIPEAMLFLPSAGMVYFLPIIAEHNDDISWLRECIRKLFVCAAVVNAVIAACMFLFAPYIIVLFWGEEYLDSVVCFRILSVNYFFAGTFRIACTNLLAAMRKINFNLILSIFAFLFNILLDFILISNYSATGAAAATLTTVTAISVSSVCYLLYSIRNYKKA